MKLPDIEAVSAQVHQAWIASKRAQGVTLRCSETGEELMVPYGELSEAAKELDRGSVRAVFEAIAATTAHQPKVICLCGSTRFIEQFATLTWILERGEGAIVLGCTLLPMWFCGVPSHFGEATGTKEQCDEHHRRKIDLADEVLVIDIGGYIGESTRGEIEYATAIRKPIRYLSNEPELMLKSLPASPRT